MNTYLPVIILLLSVIQVAAEPVRVEIARCHGQYVLLREGQPYFIKGAGGTRYLDRLAAAGGNSLRTWGDTTRELLDEAQALGLTVCVGLWIEHERHGFDYHNEQAVQAQIARHCAEVDRWKDHPAVLLWGIGNEVELDSKNPKVWDTVEAVAAHIRKVDPFHPTMTVVAHAPAEALREIRERCPSIQILGSNSYGGLSVLPEALLRHGWDGPYLVTEWGPNGTWEASKTSWGAEIETTSSETARLRAVRHSLIAGDRTRCLGGYVFVWGAKQETTATWYGMFLPDGRATESVEVFHELWNGQPVHEQAPRLSSLRLNGQVARDNVKVLADSECRLEYTLLRGRVPELQAHWTLRRESEDKQKGGDREAVPQAQALSILEEKIDGILFRAPTESGAWRLFLELNGPGHTVATANFPFWVGDGR